MESWIKIEDVWKAPEQGQAFAPLRITGEETVDLFSAYIRQVHVRPICEYAGWMKLSTIELNALIRHATGMIAVEWLRKLVIQDARGVLLYTDKPLAEVAELLHFGSANAFTNYFTHYQKESPSNYRRTHRTIEKVYKVNLEW
jgi:AraC-like DNA-binding protein